MSLNELTIHELSELLRKGEITSSEIVQDVFERIENVDETIGAYLTTFKDNAFYEAQQLDKKRDFHHPLTGIPLAIKDIICTKGLRTTCGSKILENFIPPYNATVMEKLQSTGMIMVGKTNMDEFAMGSSNENSYFKVVKNPWDTTRIPGGSSGGSAAAVAANMCIAAIGSDTGGSIRLPASFCGIVGLKPTYGRVSRYGLVAYASSLDQIGPMVKDTEDAAILMNTISGYDPLDSTSGKVPVPDYTKALIDNIEGFILGIPREYFIDGMDEEVEVAIRSAINMLHACGAEIVEVSLPHTEYAVATYYLIAPAEASSNLARYDGIRYGFREKDFDGIIDMYEETRSKGFGTEVKRRIMIGTYGLSAGYYDAYYRKASQVRTLIRRDFEEAFVKCDAIITPVAPSVAFKLGEKVGDPLMMYLTDIFTIPANLAGIPGITLSCGYSKEGMPIGMQILGSPFDEEKLFRIAYTYEQITKETIKKRPNL